MQDLNIKKEDDFIYMDNASSTKTDEIVIEEMLPFITGHYGNPSSIHKAGFDVKEKIEEARKKVARLINAEAEEIYFTSCGTESNNFALFGISDALKSKGNHIISSEIEHISVLNPLKELKKRGFEVTLLPVDDEGFIDIDKLEKSIKKETILISVMHANNEIGTIQKIYEISEIAASKGITFHSDAVATAGIIPVDVGKLGVSALSFSSQQMHGPKGTAALYLKKGTRIRPSLLGGVQERGRRAGTENVAGIIGFGKACEIANSEIDKNAKKLIVLRDKLIDGIKKSIKDIKLNGSIKHRLPGNVHISFEYVEGESIVLFLNMENIYVATGSSCASQALKSSHVCSAIGLGAATSQGSILFSLSKYNTAKEIDKVLKSLPPIIDKLRKMSPLYKG
ncbi:MAG: aminotransferase class V-fold PLP-dependent enzyme [Actinomycetota bacterium]|nr:aminotransferase class V-fold PLP-dependent enzyme [Actinomycetota bacterium]